MKKIELIPIISISTSELEEIMEDAIKLQIKIGFANSYKDYAWSAATLTAFSVGIPRISLDPNKKDEMDYFNEVFTKVSKRLRD